MRSSLAGGSCCTRDSGRLGDPSAASAGGCRSGMCKKLVLVADFLVEDDTRSMREVHTDARVPHAGGTPRGEGATLTDATGSARMRVQDFVGGVRLLTGVRFTTL